MFEKTYSPPELAELWKVNPDKIRSWIARGLLVAANLGNGTRPRLRITEQEAERFWRSRTSAPAKPARKLRSVTAPAKKYF